MNAANVSPARQPITGPVRVEFLIMPGTLTAWVTVQSAAGVEDLQVSLSDEPATFDRGALERAVRDIFAPDGAQAA